jgi:23S rRNA pseudouridine1911/1915/1917 synthase
MSIDELEILLEDGPLLAVNKPSGIITQGAPHGVDALIDVVKQYLRAKYNKPGNVYLGVPHRLDRPVSGVVVFSRNSKCAARLAEQFAQRQVQKVYWACLERPPEPAAGELVDWIYRIPDHSRVEISFEGREGAKPASLSYRVLERRHGLALVEIVLHTGRMHQIRIQFGSRGCPIVGDAQYGAATEFAGRTSREQEGAAIALHARRLTLRHPIRYDEATIVAPLSKAWRYFEFDADRQPAWRAEPGGCVIPFPEGIS